MHAFQLERVNIGMSSGWKRELPWCVYNTSDGVVMWLYRRYLGGKQMSHPAQDRFITKRKKGYISNALFTSSLMTSVHLISSVAGFSPESLDCGSLLSCHKRFFMGKGHLVADLWIVNLLVIIYYNWHDISWYFIIVYSRPQSN